MKTNYNANRDNLVTFIIGAIMIFLVAIAMAGDARAYDIDDAMNPDPYDVNYIFELPVQGSTGYGVVDLVIRAGDSNQTAKIGAIKAGEPFTIIGIGEKYFEVDYNGTIGYVYQNYTMVNLPDLMPSIIYNCTNAYNSQYRSGGNSLDGVTGQVLYTGKTWNARLEREEYNMPVLFTMAKKLAAAQSAMKADGYSLVLYEGYRPMETQKLVCNALNSLANSNSTVNSLINNSGWNKSWFIAQGVSNHQKGYAVDISIAKVGMFSDFIVNHQFVDIPTQYSEMEMPTKIHELSPAAASLAYGVSSKSATAWKSVPNADTMNDAALLLRDYCVNAGLTPLASEWWHFNDLEAMNQTGGQGTGAFEITGNTSIEWVL